MCMYLGQTTLSKVRWHVDSVAKKLAYTNRLNVKEIETNEGRQEDEKSLRLKEY